jgi:hypothetical protein
MFFPSERMLPTMKTHRCFSTSIIAFVFFASVTLTDCSRMAPAGKESPLDTATLEVACNLGRYPACVSLGTNYLRGNGVVKDNARALSLFQRSCDGGNAEGCALLGLMYQMGWGGVPKDVAHAQKLYRASCDGGGVIGCYNLGALYGLAMELRRTGPPHSHFINGHAMAGSPWGASN